MIASEHIAGGVRFYRTSDRVPVATYIDRDHRLVWHMQPILRHMVRAVFAEIETFGGTVRVTVPRTLGKRR